MTSHLATTADAMTGHPATTPSAKTRNPASTAVTAPPKRSTAAAGVVIAGSESAFGTVLFDGGGQAIYLFDRERTATPDCYGECAAAWPPVLTKGGPTAGPGVDQSKLGTTTRTGGATQVTYAGHPLYFFAHEGKNVVTCHNVSEFGGLWLAVTPAGAPA